MSQIIKEAVEPTDEPNEKQRKLMESRRLKRKEPRELDFAINCGAMGKGDDSCCGCIYWSKDGKLICNECGTEFELKIKSEEPEAGEFTKKVRKFCKTNLEKAEKINAEDFTKITEKVGLYLRDALEIIDRRAAEIKAKDERFNILANHVVDMSLAIIGWRKKVSFDSEKDLIGELERMISEALKLVPTGE